MNKLYFFFLLQFGWVASIAAQDRIEVPLQSPSVVSSEIDAATAAILQESITELVNRYARLGTFFDGGSFSNQKASDFRDLFSASAKVYKDYDAQPPLFLIDDTEYVEGAYQRLRKQGIRFLITRAFVESLPAPTSGYYTPTVVIYKQMFNLIERNGKITQLENGKTIQLRIKIDIPVQDLNTPKITKIELEDPVPPAADYVTNVGLGVRYGLSQLNNSTLSNQFTATQNNTFDAGFLLRTNRLSPTKDKNKNIFITAGAFIGQRETIGELTNYQSSGRAEDDGNNYERTASNIEVTESTTVSVLTIPIGVEYRLLDRSRYSAYANVSLYGSIPYSHVSKATGSGNYSAYYSDIDLTVAGLASADGINSNNSNAATLRSNLQLGEQPISNSNLNLTTQTGFGLQFSPTFRYHLSQSVPLFAIEVGVNYSYQLRGWINTDSSAASDLLLFPNQLTDSLIERYLDTFQPHSLGFRVGFLYQLVRTPR